MLALLLACGALPVVAEEHPETTAEDSHHEESADHSEHHFHRNHFAVFLGVTEEEEHSAFSVGFDYERRLTRLFGIGALIDFATGDVRSGVWGIPFILHPGKGWKLYVAPGRENGSERDAEFMFRVGVLYDFEVGKVTISPAFNVDLVDGEEIYVYGVNIGRGW